MPQPTQGQGQRKSQSAIVQAANSRSNSAKKAWSHCKNKEKLNNAVFLECYSNKNRNINNQITSDCFCSGRQVQNQWICCQTSNIALCRGGNISFSGCLTQQAIIHSICLTSS